MMNITLTSEITVEEIQWMGSDEMIVKAAKVSTGRDEEKLEEKDVSGLIRFLMRARHGSPFEHGLLTVRVHAPIKVWREWHRHRIGSYNEESGRYKQLDPVFYVPPKERPSIRPEGFKSSRPAFDTATDEEHEKITKLLHAGYMMAYATYEEMLKMQVDRGLARDVLGVGIYSSCYVTLNPRSIMHFLELRTDHPEAKRPSKPLYEIAVAAGKLEEIFARRWPITHREWVENGRMAP